ncbi:hypothetical protein BHM03_00038642 [Ensete ventricosum]|nr:hypothetical protein BHM03_00038642 [Ensete ventricosum]
MEATNSVPPPRLTGTSDLKEFTVAGDEELKGVECRPTNVYMFQASEAFILHNIIFYKLLQAMALYWSRKPRGEIPWHKTQCTLSSLQIYLLDIQVTYQQMPSLCHHDCFKYQEVLCLIILQVGFDMIDAFAQSLGISMASNHFKSLFGEGLLSSSSSSSSSSFFFFCYLNTFFLLLGMVGGTPVLLAKPQTYMNLSGESVSTPLERVFLPYLCRCLMIWTCHVECFVCNLKEDMDVTKGITKRAFNLLMSVIYHFRGNREFARLRIGKVPLQLLAYKIIFYHETGIWYLFFQG